MPWHARDHRPGRRLSHAGSVLKGVTAAESASYNAQVARNQAIVESQNAQHAAGATAAATEKTGLEERAAGANARAGLAANNLDVNTGSPATVQEGNRTLGAFDQAVTANRGAEAVYGYQTQATNDQAKAILDQSQVGPDIAGGVLGGVGDIASGASNLPTGGGGGGGGGPGTYDWMMSGQQQGVSADEEVPF